MNPGKEYALVKRALASIPKEDLVRSILQHLREEEHVPLSIFTTTLSPLEAIVRYLKEAGRKTKEIAEVLHKQPASISEAYRNAKRKVFKPKLTKHYIPLREFQKQPTLSILEVVVTYLHSQPYTYSTIAKMLKRDPRTIWTIHNRAKKKHGMA